MATLVDNLLLLSELDTDYRRWKLQIDDLRTFVDHWAAKLSFDLRGCLQVNVANEAVDYQVQVDRDAFHLILDNLLDNSCRFSSSKPSIQILLIQSKSFIELHRRWSWSPK